ncbi:ATP-binding protein [Oerskovia sp. KBS0722]|uniref:ATP-binding protein n=1 Tax=Oerskovia sp. KBS0722 TaxID=1179673 RepID=UPI00110E2CED|nr:SbcC/MukB-like Walker B domain-containing protein [Oerskovia sp. KBS0722]QDW62292.1 AAA family ATPase [Oerskovia sp. KBS0722]
MAEALFSAVELHDAAADLDQRSGYRLDRLEVLNWGTFDKYAWSFELEGRNALLTGDIGSGKSTIVDAITTLLLPANRISYNKAAGADTRERTLRSYVAGHYKSERNEVTGASRHVGLRRGHTYSVILGEFANRGFDSRAVLAQVFWLKDGAQGQPERFYVTSTSPMTIADDFAGFDGDINVLRRRLRESGAQIRDHFPEYGRDFRRLLGIESEQAMELFHQTVSMKSVGDLNEFVREHMLEPFDAARWTEKLVAHFDDLTSAHDAVVKARAQIDQLAPLLADADAYDAAGEQVRTLSGQREALRGFTAGRRVEALDLRIGELEASTAARADGLDRLKEELSLLDAERQRLEVERAGHGGDRLTQIEGEVARREVERAERRAKADEYARYLAAAGLDPVTSRDEFAALRERTADLQSRAQDALGEIEGRAGEVAAELRAVEAEAREINAELTSLADRESNLPRTSLDLRSRLCSDVGLTEADLPFAGELIGVRAEHAEWEGAAERVLRGFALSLLVPAHHYDAVSAWINAHDLRSKLVYHRVPAPTGGRSGKGRGAVGTPASRDDGPLLADLLEVKDGDLATWLSDELERRADYVCAEALADFQRVPRAVTREGQVKHSASHHEKDDRRAVRDRSGYVLGWSNQGKIDALLDEATDVTTRRTALEERRDAVGREKNEAISRSGALNRLDVFREWRELDWEEPVRAIAELHEEKRRIEGASTELSRIADQLRDLARRAAGIASERDALLSAAGADKHALDSARTQRDRSARVLTEQGPLDAALVGELARLFDVEARDQATAQGGAPGDVEPDAVESALRTRLTSRVEEAQARQGQLGTRIAAQMTAFRAAYPVETTELDNDVRSAPEYRALHERLTRDDLPRFEVDFKTYLNTNTIRDIAGFHAELSKQADLIRERVEIINDSLRAIDYNPGRYIRLEMAPTPNTEVREFRADLRACTDGALGLDLEGRRDEDTGEETVAYYSEERFLRVKAIVERFRGREGQAEADEAWKRRVTDVRSWFVLSASERSREDDVEHEHYSDSGGKSGGQKEKLAYTILAASLAYQFKLDWGAVRSKAFRFVVIDEAFGRGSDESTRFALELFKSLGLQLLIVTPLQKIHVIEPYISAVGYVDNPTGRNSRLRTLTIEEYQQEKEAHAAL